MKNLFVSYNFASGHGDCVLIDFDNSEQIETWDDICRIKKSIINGDPNKMGFTEITINNFIWLPVQNESIQS